MINEKLKTKRVSFGLTQKKLSESLGMTEVSYNRKEQGKRDFTLSELKKLSHALSLNANDIEEIFFKD